MSERASSRRALAAALAAAALAGCAHYRAKPISPEKTLDEFAARSLDGPELARFMETNHEAAPGPDRPWGLRALTLAAFFYSPDLDVARADLDAARAGVVSAGARENPAASLSAGFDSTTDRAVITPWILGFNLDVPLTTAGKRRHRVAQATSLVEAARYNLASVAWGVRSRVRSSVVELDAASQAESLLAEQEAAQTQVVELIGKQLEAGEISSVEVTQARLALASTTLARREAAARAVAARGRLADALGVPLAALEGRKVSFDGLDGPAELPAPEARRQALTNRADVLGALAEYAAAQAALQLEVARQYPDVHLGPGYEYDQGDDKWFLAVSLPVPLLNRNRGPIAEAEAARTAAGARFVAVQARAVAEVDGAAAAYRQALEGAATADRMSGDLERGERLAEARFAAGETSRLDLDNAKVERVAGALARLDAVVRVRAALGQLEDAMQRSAETPDWFSTPPPRGEAPDGGKGHP